MLPSVSNCPSRALKNKSESHAKGVFISQGGSGRRLVLYAHDGKLKYGGGLAKGGDVTLY
jgi:hypothetical protein